MRVARPGTIRWKRNRPPTRAVQSYIANVPTSVAVEFVEYLKANAGGSLAQNSGQRWPVKSGYSRDRFKVAGRTSHRNNARVRGAREEVAIEGAPYYPYVDRRGPRGSIIEHVFERFLRSTGRRRAEQRTARAVNRPTLR